MAFCQSPLTDEAGVHEYPKLHFLKVMLLLVIVLVLGNSRRMLSQEERGEGEVAAQPHAAQIPHCVARSQDGQTQRHKDAAHHEDGKHEERLHGTQDLAMK